METFFFSVFKYHVNYKQSLNLNIYDNVLIRDHFVFNAANLIVTVTA